MKEDSQSQPVVILDEDLNKKEEEKMKEGSQSQPWVILEEDLNEAEKEKIKGDSRSQHWVILEDDLSEEEEEEKTKGDFDSQPRLTLPQNSAMRMSRNKTE